MNQDINPLDLIVRDLSQSTSPVILLPQNPSLDALHAALGLYLGLSTLGKNVVVATSNQVKQQIKDGGVIRTELTASGDNLVISFPYTDGSIDKVDYRIENNTFNLIIIPRPGFPKVTPEQMAYSYSGGSIDCIITLDAPTIESLGKIYADHKQTLDPLPLVNIDTHQANTQYGSVNYVVPTVSSVSQLTFDVLRGMQIRTDAVMATHILHGIVASTNNFTAANTSADVFTDVAELMKLGAVREPIAQDGPSRTSPPSAAARSGGAPSKPQNQNPQGGQQARARNPQQQNQGPQRMQPQSGAQQQQKTQGNQPKPPQGRQTQQSPAPRPRHDDIPPAQVKAQEEASWIEQIPADEQPTSPSDGTDQKPKEAPQDWLKPKIFKGNGFV